jgi:glycosyltransferase involved in cell wall biosynthesis
MSARRVLILCYFYPPLAGGGVHRVLGFTRHLPAHGWECTVIAAGREDYWVTDESLETRIPASAEVIRVRGGSALSTWLRVRRGDRGRRTGSTYAGLRRLSDWWLFPDAYAGWASRALSAASGRIAAGGIDAVLTTSPPDSVHLAGLALKRRFGLPWVADFRDPWVGLHFRNPPTAWHRARHARAERAVLEGADRVLTASRTHLDTLGARSDARVPPERAIHLPNGFEPEAPGANEVTADAEAFTLVFTGTLSQMSDTEVFLEALHELLARRPEARRRVRARMVGPYQAEYADRATALGLTGIVTFLGTRPHAESRALQRGADALLLWKPRGYPTMVPGKLYEYLDAGRPILGVLEEGDEAAAMVRRAGGELVAPGDRMALAAAIERRYLAWKEGARPAPSRPEWVATHARPALAARLASVLDELTTGRT